MENATIAALSKQIALARALDAAANNVANQTTAGYKAERVEFREYLANINTEGGADAVSLVHDVDSFTDFSAGGLETTRAPLDFAIDGEGFFAVETDAGVRYTRDGHFSLNAFGELVNRDGALVLGQNGAPILMDPEAGPLSLSPEGELQQDGTPIAELGVFSFAEPRVLRREGANLFRAVEEPEAARGARIRQGFIETSNVSPVAMMTRMIDILRAYENAAEVANTSTALERDAVATLLEEA